MIDDYTDEEGASILEEDELEDTDDVFIKRLAAALTKRLDSVSQASSSADNFRRVAQALGEITQDEAMVAAIRTERQRRINAAEKRLEDARATFSDIITSLHPADAGEIGSEGQLARAEAARFAQRLAVSEHAKAMVKKQQASERLYRAQDADAKAQRELTKKEANVKDAGKLLSAPGPNTDPAYAAYTGLPAEDKKRVAEDALVQFKEALAQHRSDVADAQWDYADRLKRLRDGQNARIGKTITDLQGTTPPALPIPDAESRGTSIKLRAVR